MSTWLRRTWSVLAALALAAPVGHAQAAGPTRETATLGGGCFWCLEAIYKEVRGVDQVVSGYAGGRVANPTYDQVSHDDTGHAEAVQLTFDPGQVSYKDLLEVFFTIHDPTTRDRQGADVGPQYRSVVFYHSPEQERTARAVMRGITAAGLYKDPLVTQVEPYQAFYAAERYHQDYYARNPVQPYCMLVITPKVLKFRAKHLARIKNRAR